MIVREPRASAVRPGDYTVSTLFSNNPVCPWTYRCSWSRPHLHYVSRRATNCFAQQSASSLLSDWWAMLGKGAPSPMLRAVAAAASPLAKRHLGLIPPESAQTWHGRSPRRTGRGAHLSFGFSAMSFECDCWDLAA